MLDPNWDPYESLLRAEHQIMYQAELLENLAGQLSDQSRLIEQMSYKMTLIFEALGTQNKFNTGMFEQLMELKGKEQP
jgi:uncharacterized coiled-coil protein SlyX